MIINFVLGIISLLFLSLVHDKKRCLKWVFLVLTVFLGIRYEWGNDYLSYLDYYDELIGYQFGLFDISSSKEAFRNNEFGWVILNRIFGAVGLGFFGMVIFLSILENWAIYRIISKYVEPRYYCIAVFVYVMTTGIFAVGASMMRQYLCICLYLFVIDLMLEKKQKGYLLWSILIILLGSTIHRSNIVMLITLPIFYIRINGNNNNNNNGAIWSLLFCLLFVAWDLFGEALFSKSLFWLLGNQEEFESYASYLGENAAVTKTGLGALFRYVLFFSFVILLPTMERKMQLVFLLYLLSDFIVVVSAVAPMIGRFGMYLEMVIIIIWPYIFSIAKHKKFYYALFAGQMIVMVKAFFDFYHHPTWIDAFMHYHTIFEAPHWM